MSVTKKDIANIFNVLPSAIDQIGSKQLFKVMDYNKGVQFLVSYRTIIGIYHDPIWKITTKKYSNTTSRQITAFSRGQGDKISRISNEELIAFLPDSLKHYAR